MMPIIQQGALGFSANNPVRALNLRDESGGGGLLWGNGAVEAAGALAGKIKGEAPATWGIVGRIGRVGLVGLGGRDSWDA